MSKYVPRNPTCSVCRRITIFSEGHPDKLHCPNCRTPFDPACSLITMAAWRERYPYLYEGVKPGVIEE